MSPNIIGAFQFPSYGDVNQWCFICVETLLIFVLLGICCVTRANPSVRTSRPSFSICHLRIFPSVETLSNCSRWPCGWSCSQLTYQVTRTDQRLIRWGLRIRGLLWPAIVSKNQRLAGIFLVLCLKWKQAFGSCDDLDFSRLRGSRT